MTVVITGDGETHFQLTLSDRCLLLPLLWFVDNHHCCKEGKWHLFGSEVAVNSDCFALLHSAEMQSSNKLWEAFSYIYLLFQLYLRKWVVGNKASKPFKGYLLFLFDIPQPIVHCAQISHVAGYKLIRDHKFKASDCQVRYISIMHWIYSVSLHKPFSLWVYPLWKLF